MINRRLLIYTRKYKSRGGTAPLLAGLVMAVCLLLSSQLQASPLPAPPAPPTIPTLAADSTFYGHYPFIHFIDSKEDAGLVRISDEDFLDKAGKVVFKVNKYDTFTNDSLLQLLEKDILPRINKDSLRLRRIIVRGASSPEGPVANNRMLGRRRVETLSLFLRAHLSVPVTDESLSTEVVFEDYNLLLVMMERAGDPATEMVRSLCEKHLPRYEYTILKRKLQQLQGGTLWRHLLRDYFPELRAARVVLVFDKPEAPQQPQQSLTAMQTNKGQDTHTAQIVQEYDDDEITHETQEPQVVRVPRREVLSVKTNLLLYGFYMPGGYNRWCPIPNVAVEFYPLHGHFTYGASIDFPWWQSYNEFKFFQVRNYQLETRYYFRSGDINRRTPGEGAAFKGLYLQGYINAGLFNICLDKDTGWEGEYLGAGLGVGYMLPLTRKGHWRLEFSLQAGFVYGMHDPYQFENLVNPSYHDQLYYYRWSGKASDFEPRQYRFSWLGPTRVGITLTYDLLYHRWKKKGISFRPSETVVEE